MFLFYAFHLLFQTKAFDSRLLVFVSNVDAVDVTKNLERGNIENIVDLH